MLICLSPQSYWKKYKENQNELPIYTKFRRRKEMISVKERKDKVKNLERWIYANQGIQMDCGYIPEKEIKNERQG